jgi:hypothetical protein
LTGFELKEVLSMPVSYAEICRASESNQGFCGVADDEPPPYGNTSPTNDDDEGLYGTEEGLYAEVLQLLEAKYLEDRFSMCIEIRDGDRVVYAFPKLACPELFLEKLRTEARKL